MLKFYFTYATTELDLPALEVEAEDWDAAMKKADALFKRKVIIFTDEERKQIHLKSIEYCDTDTGQYVTTKVANNI
jgi:hypothetical protein